MKVVTYRRSLFNIIFFFFIFDGIRSNILFNEIISPLKELAILLIFIETMRVKKITLQHVTCCIGVPLTVFYIYHLFVSFLSLFSLDGASTSETFLNCYKFSQLFMLSMALCHFSELYHADLKSLFRLLVKYSLIYTALNTTSVFIDLPIWKELDIWYGRFGMGYPTSDTASLSLVLSILNFCDLGYKPFRKGVYIGILLLSISMQVTGSSLVILPFLFISILSLSIIQKDVRLIKGLIGSLILIMILSGTALDLVRKHDPVGFEAASELIDVKIGQFVFNEEIDHFDSKQARANQYEYAKRLINNPISSIFGAGISRFSMRPATMATRNVVHIENVFYVLRICYGLIGISLFLLFVFTFCFRVANSRIKLSDKFLLANFMFIASVSSSALVALYLIQVFGVYALSIGYFHEAKIKYRNSLILKKYEKSHFCEYIQ